MVQALVRPVLLTRHGVLVPKAATVQASFHVVPILAAAALHVARIAGADFVGAHDSKAVDVGQTEKGSESDSNAFHCFQLGGTTDLGGRKRLTSKRVRVIIEGSDDRVSYVESSFL